MGKRDRDDSWYEEPEDVAPSALDEQFAQLFAPETLDRIERILQSLYPQGVTRRADEIAAKERLLRFQFAWQYGSALLVIILISIGIYGFHSDPDMVKLFLIGGLAFLGGSSITPSLREAFERSRR